MPKVPGGGGGGGGGRGRGLKGGKSASGGISDKGDGDSGKSPLSDSSGKPDESAIKEAKDFLKETKSNFRK